MNTPNSISWQEAGKTKTSVWHSENAAPVPKKIQLADDTIKADDAYKLACEGTALLWRGDFQNAKLLLQAQYGAANIVGFVQQVR